MNCFKKRQVESPKREIEDTPKKPVPEKTDYDVWIPFAERISKTENLWMKSRGEYEHGYPEGLVVHYISGWHLKRGVWARPYPQPTPRTQSLEKISREYSMRTARLAIDRGWNFLIMGAFGELFQSRDLTKWGSHAGKSYWDGVGYSVSKNFTGVEIMSPGELKRRGGKFFTWFDYEVPKEHVREVNGRFWHQFSIEQENQLVRLCLFLVRNSPRKPNGDLVFQIRNIVGHDEISPGRKADPGGSLSFGMQGLRDRVLRELKR